MLAIAAAPASADRVQGAFFCPVSGPCTAIPLPAGLPDLAGTAATYSFQVCSSLGGGLTELLPGLGTVQLCSTDRKNGEQGTIIGEITVAPLDTGVNIDTANSGPADPCAGSTAFGGLDLMGIGGALGLSTVNDIPGCSISPPPTS